MIHPTALIDPTARIASNVEIGPWAIIGKNVDIGEGTWIGPHVVIEEATIGNDNKIFQFASLGAEPQDKKYAGEATRLTIGHRNVIREFCTFNRGTVQDNSITSIGNDNLFMAYVHIAHDCLVGNHTIFANNASLAGHVKVDDCVILGGFTGIFQACQLGAYSFTSMGSMVNKDVPPFVKVSGYYAKPYGLNTVGMRRHGFEDQTMANLRQAYKLVYRKGLTTALALTALATDFSHCPHVQNFRTFIQQSKRGIIR